MDIMTFSRAHIEQALALALENYAEERGHVRALPDVSCLPDISVYADNGLGVAAVEHGTLAGFLCAHECRNTFGNRGVDGVFSPLHAKGAARAGRARIYARLYQAAAELWVSRGLRIHSVCLYEHDTEAVMQFFRLGFGGRCVDAVRGMEEIPVRADPPFALCEADGSELGEIYRLQSLTDEHLRRSPAFVRFPGQSLQEFHRETLEERHRYFIAGEVRRPAAYLKVAERGETFVSELPGVKNICGAYCLPEYRGTGLALSLLNHVIRTLKSEGVTCLGTDYESMNPAAQGFWPKHFDAYTAGVVRRIDEGA